MAKVTYIEHSGVEHVIDVSDGWTLMEGAVKSLTPGIDADCGGACACATCHVYVDPLWLDKIGPITDMEKTMLEFAVGVASNSRLACQIQIVPELNGLTVRMPKAQH